MKTIEQIKARIEELEKEIAKRGINEYKAKSFKFNCKI